MSDYENVNKQHFHKQKKSGFFSCFITIAVLFTFILFVGLAIKVYSMEKKGQKGDKGDKGDSGAAGANGRDGKQGSAGKDALGTPGRDGIDGQDGQQGATGKRGPPGKDGDLTVTPTVLTSFPNWPRVDPIVLEPLVVPELSKPLNQILNFFDPNYEFSNKGTASSPVSTEKLKFLKQGCEANLTSDGLSQSSSETEKEKAFLKHLKKVRSCVFFYYLSSEEETSRSIAVLPTEEIYSSLAASIQLVEANISLILSPNIFYDKLRTDVSETIEDVSILRNTFKVNNGSGDLIGKVTPFSQYKSHDLFSRTDGSGGKYESFGHEMVRDELVEKLEKEDELNSPPRLQEKIEFLRVARDVEFPGIELPKTIFVEFEFEKDSGDYFNLETSIFGKTYVLERVLIVYNGSGEKSFQLSALGREEFWVFEQGLSLNHKEIKKANIGEEMNGWGMGRASGIKLMYQLRSN